MRVVTIARKPRVGYLLTPKGREALATYREGKAV